MNIHFQVIDDEVLKKGFGIEPNQSAISITITNYGNGEIDYELIEKQFLRYENLEHFATNVGDDGEHMQMLVIDKLGGC